jgi:outer membrane protein assembly factor BamB
MSFIQIKYIKNVDKYDVLNQLYVLSESNLSIYNLSLENETMINQVFCFALREDYLYYQNKNIGEILLLDLRTKKKSILNGNFSIYGKIVFGSKSFYILNQINEKNFFSIIDYQSQEIISNIQMSNSLLICELKKGLLFKKKNELFCLSVNNFEKEWIFIIDEWLRINGNIIVDNNLILFTSNNGNLFCIDTDLGSKKWEITDCLEHFTKHPISGNLYGFHGERYQVIDTLKGEKIVDTIFEGSKEKYRILPSQNVNKVYEDGLYFVSNTYGCKFGKIDIENHCIDFVQDLGVKPGVEAYTPTYKDGKIYILDSEKTLHIFEKE